MFIKIPLLRIRNILLAYVLTFASLGLATIVMAEETRPNVLLILPDSSVLPDTVQEFVVNEKWPQGSYSSMGLEVDGRLAVLAMPIVAMGWGRNEVGKWTTRIGFRIRESTEGLSDRLSEAYASGEPFEVTREDGRADIIYTQNQTMPSWVQEAGGDWRVFQYHYSQEISDYAHVFYTQLGVNIVVYVFTQ
jgi:hypothetical protein|tara:strand:- start:654 stop:1226 length:573 start_codon:yes stop_codon:yes gene_type:complete